MKGKTGHDVHEAVRQAALGKDVVFVMKPKGRVLMQRYCKHENLACGVPRGCSSIRPPPLFFDFKEENIHYHVQNVFLSECEKR